MDDADTVRLLELLRDYYVDYGATSDPPSTMTVAALAEDLTGSLPREQEPEGIEVLR